MNLRQAIGKTTHRILRRGWHSIEATPAAPLAWRVRRSPRIVRRTVGGWLGRAALAVGGPDSMAAVGVTAERSSWGSLPRIWRISPSARVFDSGWPEPPPIDEPARVIRSIYETGPNPPVMDLELMQALHAEYRDKPLVPAPPGLGQAARQDRAQSRLSDVHASIDLAGKRVLELGCGPGFEVWYMSHKFGADAWGVDVGERKAWGILADDRTHFVCTDIAVERSFEADFFDRVVSFSVFEHVVHPHAVLVELYRVMKPGGIAFIMANLHRGPRASHLYREISFPFPHLLFTDDVIRQFREAHGGKSAGASWVNRLTWAQYEDYFREIGFVIRSLRFSEQPLDEPFYERFENILGRYPKWDLTKDFFHVILEKPMARR